MVFDEKKYKSLLYPVIENYDKFCRDNNLRYTIYAGTLLGAVRHGGMIPWDDDIDVLMPRPDYNKFIELSKEVFIPGFKVVNAYNDHYCYTTFSKVVDCNTTLVEMASIKNAVIGAYIDVFPLDGVDVDEEEAERHYQEFLKLVKKTRTTRYEFCFKDLFTRVAGFRSYLQNKYFRSKYDYNELLKNCDKLASRTDYEKSTITRIYCSPNHSKKLFPREWFDEYIDMKFDHLTLRSIKEWDKFLTTLFKDYMKLPPEEKRITHHSHVYFNPDHGYSYEELVNQGLL